MASEARTILLVDDEPDILESMKEYLESMLDGLTVLTASSGKAGLLLMDKNKVELIITDYKMPEMNGLEFLREAAKKAPTVPRIILTAFPKLELAIQAINEVEVDRFLTKPIRPEELERLVKTFLEKTAARRTGGASAFGDMPGKKF